MCYVRIQVPLRGENNFKRLRLFVWKLPRAQGLGKWPECPYFKFRFRFYSFAMFSVKKSTRSDDTQ